MKRVSAKDFAAHSDAYLAGIQQRDRFAIMDANQPRAVISPVSQRELDAIERQEAEQLGWLKLSENAVALIWDNDPSASWALVSRRNGGACRPWLRSRLAGLLDLSPSTADPIHRLLAGAS
jgi:hypothetical protein